MIDILSAAEFVTMLIDPPTEQSVSMEAPAPFWTWIAEVAPARPIQLFQYIPPEVSPEIGIPLRDTEMFSWEKPLMLSLASP